jgi:hypothetical protein
VASFIKTFNYMLTLKNVLRINGISSGATGLGLIVFASAVADLFGVSNSAAIQEVGVFLVVFALFVLWESQRTIHRWKIVRLIIALDSMWVLASGVIVILQLFNLTMLGYLSIGAVAAWVAGMAYLQNAASKEINSAKV